MPTVHSEHIPRELKQRRQWVCWRAEERDGKLTKIPYAVHGGRASANNPDTWTPFRDAVKHAKSAGMSGIGFVFSEDDPYTGLDLDGCHDPETGELEEWARQIVRELDSYAEVSPSGSGVHAFVKAALPEGGNRKGPLEMYDAGRFFTVTGERLESAPAEICDRQDELDAIHARMFQAEPARTTPADCAPGGAAAASGSGVSDEEIVRRATEAKNGAKVADLWAGKWEGYGYSSQSEADQALCSLLAWWTGPDEERIANLVRQSGLYRPKWDRADYCQRTVQGALAGKTEFYEGPQRGTGDGGGGRRGRSHLHAVSDEAGDGEAAPVFLYTPGSKSLAIHASGAVFRVRKTKDGHEHIPQGYEAPRVLERIRVPGDDVPDGEHLHYLLEHDGTEELCSYRKLRDGLVWERMPGLEFLGADRTSVGDGANIVLRLAREAPAYTGHNKTGWQEFEDGSGESRYGYIRPDGVAIHAGGASRARMVEPFAKLAPLYERCPEVPDEDVSSEEIHNALGYARLLTRDRGQTLLALGASARALTNGIERAGFAAILEGPRATGKTSIASLARSLVLPHSHPAVADASFSGTAASLENALGPLDSFPAHLDDLAISRNATPGDVAGYSKALDRVARSTFNNDAMRPRMARDGSARPSTYLNTVTFITAEELPPALQSAERRVLLLPLGESEAPHEMLAESGRYAPGLLALGHRLLRRTCTRVEEHGREEVAGELRAARDGFYPRLKDALEAEIGRPLPQMCESLPQIGSEVLLGLQLLEEAAELSAGELTEPGVRHLAATLSEQVGRMEGRDGDGGEGPFGQLVERFRENIRRGLPFPGSGAKLYRLAAYDSSPERDDAPPAISLSAGSHNYPAASWGFRQTGNEEDETRGPVTVGYVKAGAGEIQLSRTAREALREIAKKTPGAEHLASSDRAMGRAAKEEGWVVREGTRGELSVRTYHHGEPERVLSLSLDRYLDTGDEDAPAPEQDAPGPESPGAAAGSTQPDEPGRADELPQPESPAAAAEDPGEPEEVEEPGGAEDMDEPEEPDDLEESPEPDEPPGLPDRVRQILREPWASHQAALCRGRDGERLVRPLANAVTQTLCVESRGQRTEVLDIVRAHVRGEDNAV